MKLVLNAYSDGLFDFYTHRGDVRVAVRAAQAARAARVRAGLPAVGVPRGVADPGMPYLDPSIAPGTYVAVQNATPILSLAELPKKLGPALGRTCSCSRSPSYFCPTLTIVCLLYTSPSPRDRQKSRMPSSA